MEVNIEEKIKLIKERQLEEIEEDDIEYRN